MTTNEINRVREFNILQSPWRLALGLAGYLIQNSALFRFAGSVGRRSGVGRVSEPRTLSETEIGRPCDGGCSRLRGQRGAGRGSGKSLWVPIRFSSGSQTSSRSRSLFLSKPRRRRSYGWASSLFTEVHRQLEQAEALASNPGFLNLSGIFSDSDVNPVSGLLPHDRGSKRLGLPGCWSPSCLSWPESSPRQELQARILEITTEIPDKMGKGRGAVPRI